MSKSAESKMGIGELVNRTQIARTIFNAAASMGISDRDQIDQITSKVIARLERPVMLPGLEDFMPKGIKHPLPVASESDILAMVKEFLAIESLPADDGRLPMASVAPQENNPEIKS
ncbi:MAG: hypothetical protein FWC25_00910, partial [Dehalococcoidia bacterium]|nr:hypothetical protein [Dehalococcoidia bacterium]